MEILILAPLVLGALIHLTHEAITGGLTMAVHDDCGQLESYCKCDEEYMAQCPTCNDLYNTQLGCEPCDERANWTDNQAVAEHNFELAQEEN